MRKLNLTSSLYCGYVIYPSSNSLEVFYWFKGWYCYRNSQSESPLQSCTRESYTLSEPWNVKMSKLKQTVKYKLPYWIETELDIPVCDKMVCDKNGGNSRVVIKLNIATPQDKKLFTFFNENKIPGVRPNFGQSGRFNDTSISLSIITVVNSVVNYSSPLAQGSCWWRR